MSDYYIHRYACEVLDEMRKFYKTRNFSGLLGLIEELQTMFNRMEAALAEQKDLAAMHEEWHDLKDKIKQAKNELKKLEEERRELELSDNSS